MLLDALVKGRNETSRFAESSDLDWHHESTLDIVRITLNGGPFDLNW